MSINGVEPFARVFTCKQFPSCEELLKFVYDSVPDCKKAVILALSEMTKEEHKIFNNIVEF